VKQSAREFLSIIVGEAGLLPFDSRVSFMLFETLSMLKLRVKNMLSFIYKLSAHAAASITFASDYNARG